MGKHDRSYRRLFAKPRLIEELVRGFFGQDWIERLDFSTLERVNASFVSEDQKSREGDMIWKIRFRDGRPLYVYLLLEFQSDVQRFMAVRVMAYMALFYQDLIKGRELTPEGKLPLVVPIVLYNGDERWWAPLELADLIEMEGTSPAAEIFRPRLRYHLIDEGSYPVEELRSKRSLPAALFWLERMPPPEEIRQALAQFMGPLRDPEDRDLAKTFADCIQALGLLGAGEIPEGLPVGGYRIMFEKRLAERDRRLQEESLHREGEARLLLRQLERKFGPLDAPSRERIATADPERLLDWADKILEASRLQDVFGD
jgi:hypothetical protein